MNNFKKIGLTALAASLVSTSVFAGEMTVAGSASINTEGHSGTALNEATTFSMGNQLTFSGSGELDNGMTVSLSFVIDQGDDGTTVAPAAGTKKFGDAPFDSHSVSVSSDALGTLVLHGEGGGSAASALDTTAAGDMWDNFNSNGGVSVSDSGPGDNSLMYTLPALVDGLSVAASFNPQLASGKSDNKIKVANSAAQTGNSTELGYSATYTGVAKGEQTAWKASYAYGSVTVGYSNSFVDLGNTDMTGDQETTSMSISYTVSDAISITYGEETVNKKSAATDAEYSMLSGSYTAGGMTVTAKMADGENTAFGTDANEDLEYWSLGLSFAF
jgi:outer membrane protein OmpU